MKSVWNPTHNDPYAEGAATARPTAWCTRSACQRRWERRLQCRLGSDGPTDRSELTW